MQQALTTFQATNRQKFEEEEKAGRPCTSSSNVTLFPIIQAGKFRVREEEQFFQLLFGHLKKAAMRAYLPPVGSLPAGVSSIVQERPLMDLTSGYFSLYHPYQKLFLLHPQVEVRIVAASPKVCARLKSQFCLLILVSQANGFYGSPGISGRIPEGYTFLEQKFMRAVRRTADRFSIFGSGQSNIDLSEWEKDGWTYHAKG